MPDARWILALLYCCSAAAAVDDESAAGNWGQWRGPLATGVGPQADPPLLWNEADGTNVRWKTAIPGRGHSTPIVWNDRIFLTTAIATGPALPPRPSTAPGNHDNLPVTHKHKFIALAVDRASGKIVWQKTLREALPHEQGHQTGSLASASPVTDGEHLIVNFGSFGLYCLDLDGNLVWQKDFGAMQSLHGHGEGSSPVLHGNTLVVNWDHEAGSFVVALDKRTGEQLWKVDRKEITSWATPIVVEHAGRTQVIISGTGRIRGYDLATGKVLWECGGLSANVVASPVSDGRLVFAGSSYDKRALLAIRLDGAAGDITGSDRVVWNRFRGTPYVPSPLLYDDALYFLTHYQGVLNRVAASSGEDRPGAIRLDGLGNIYASPVAAAGRVYVTDLDGVTAVVSHGDVPRLLAVNRLSEPIAASAALAGRDLFLRGERSLYRLTDAESHE
jgi:outer membrane protein assembly factor BamB